ncbi:hypothetical protein ACXU4B_10210 [Dyella soli]|uniref:Uncharacterized protein n=1 Tax=Dyella soli TaxID=522319 RepID=A0A4R0YQQ0_9GAMM|nr:hypothetical protein [Dyella soli]TCI11299.1 hypothetical protein EZM97_21100 [Dyella soli]
MAVHDHTAPARPSYPTDDAFTAGSAADRPTSGPAHSMRLSTLDDIALAHHALAQLWLEDERFRVARERHIHAEPMAWPLTPMFKEGVSVAIRCLELYALQLAGKQKANA